MEGDLFMDYRAKAEAALRERAEIFEKRKALFDSDATDAEKREQAERMDADMDRLAAEARSFVEDGEREAEVRSLHERAGALSTAARSERSKDDDEAADFAAGIRAVGLGESRSFDFDVSPRAVEDFRAVLVSDGTGDNKNGVAGPLTPDTFVATLLESMTEASDVLSRIRRISTSSGEPMNWPRRVSKAGNTFQRIQENGQYQSASDGSFDLFSLSAHKFGAIAEITEEALTDPALNIGSIVAQDMGEDLAESLADAVWNSTLNGDLHQGLLPAAINVLEFASATDVTFDELIDLQHAIIGKYRRSASWTLNDDTARKVRKIKDLDDNYVWQPAVIAGQPDMLLGKPVATDPSVPALAAAARGVVFGDLRRAYVLRTVRNIGIVRSDEFGFDRDTVALKIKWRGDGGVTDTAAYAVGFGNDGV